MNGSHADQLSPKTLSVMPVPTEEAQARATGQVEANRSPLPTLVGQWLRVRFPHAGPTRMPIVIVAIRSAIQSSEPW
jgi:hypothetical protein